MKNVKPISVKEMQHIIEKNEMTVSMHDCTNGNILAIVSKGRSTVFSEEVSEKQLFLNKECELYKKSKRQYMAGRVLRYVYHELLSCHLLKVRTFDLPHQLKAVK